MLFMLNFISQFVDSNGCKKSSKNDDLIIFNKFKICFIDGII